MSTYIHCGSRCTVKELLLELAEKDKKSLLDILIRDIDAKNRNVSYVRVYDEFTRCSQHGVNFTTALKFPLDYNLVLNTG